MGSVYTVAKIAEMFLNRSPAVRAERMAFLRERNGAAGGKVCEYNEAQAADLVDDMARIEVESGYGPRPTTERY